MHRNVTVLLLLTMVLLLSGCEFVQNLLGGEDEGEGDSQAATKVHVAISAESAAGGEEFTLVVSIFDADDALVSDYAGTALLSVSDGELSVSSVALSSGSGTASVAISGITTESTVTVTAEVSGLTAGSADITISPPTATTLELSTASTAISSGDAVDLTVTAVDDAGNTVPSFTGTVSLTTSAGLLSPAEIAVSADGTATESITLSGITSDETVTVTGASGTLEAGILDLAVTGVPISATRLELSAGAAEVDDGSAVTLTVTATDDFGNIDTGFVGTVNLSADGGASLSPATIDIAASDNGSTSGDVTLSIAQLLADAPVTITAGSASLADATVDLTVLFAPEGTALLDSDLSSGWTALTGSYYLDSRSPDAQSISVGGDLDVSEGVKLVIYPGVTLDMGGNSINVHGDLEVIGTDDARVKVTSSSSGGWGGIVVGNNGGTAGLTMDGAYLDQLSGYAVSLGTVESSVTSGPASITNSRMRITNDTSQAVRLRRLSAGTSTFENNVIHIDTSGLEQAFESYSSISTAHSFNIRYNTIINNGTGGGALYIADDTGSTYEIARNLISGFGYAIAYGSTTPTLNLRNNFMRTAGDWDGMLSGGTYDTFEDNLYEGDGSNDPDNFGGPWDTSLVFEGYASGDFRLQSQGSRFPSLTQASNISSMEGSLTSGDANEVGAYGDGGYPPNVGD